jgi:hypothetical protein
MQSLDPGEGRHRYFSHLGNCTYNKRGWCFKDGKRNVSPSVRSFTEITESPKLPLPSILRRASLLGMVKRNLV